MAFIALDRGIVDHWIYQDSEYFKVWFEMLYRARYSPEPSKELIDGIIVIVNYGEFIYGRKRWSERLCISERRLRTLVEKLIAEEMIVVSKRFSKFTLYSICNYGRYNTKSDQQSDQHKPYTQQANSGTGDQQSDQQPTGIRPASDQQATTKEQGSNKEETKKEDLKDKTAFSNYTSNDNLIETLNSFVEFRKKIKAPMTDRAIKLLLGELDKLANNDVEKISILEQSILNNWKGVFGLKNKVKGDANAVNGRTDENPYAGIDFGF